MGTIKYYGITKIANTTNTPPTSLAAGNSYGGYGAWGVSPSATNPSPYWRACVFYPAEENGWVKSISAWVGTATSANYYGPGIQFALGLYSVPANYDKTTSTLTFTKIASTAKIIAARRFSDASGPGNKETLAVVESGAKIVAGTTYAIGMNILSGFPQNEVALDTAKNIRSSPTTSASVVAATSGITRSTLLNNTPTTADGFTWYNHRVYTGTSTPSYVDGWVATTGRLTSNVTLTHDLYIGGNNANLSPAFNATNYNTKFYTNANADVSAASITSTAATTNGWITAWIEYETNTAPTVTITGPDALSVATPTFSATFVDAEIPLGDKLNQFTMKLYDTTGYTTTAVGTGTKIWEYTETPTNLIGNNFSKVYSGTTALIQGTTYRIEITATDQFNASSPIAFSTFTVDSGPFVLTDSAQYSFYPKSGTVPKYPQFLFTASDATPNDTSLVSGEIEIVSPDNVSLIKTNLSGTNSSYLGGTYTSFQYNSVVGDFPTTQGLYKWRARAKDSLGTYGEWTSYYTFSLEPNEKTISSVSSAITQDNQTTAQNISSTISDSSVTLLQFPSFSVSEQSEKIVSSLSFSASDQLLSSVANVSLTVKDDSQLSVYLSAVFGEQLENKITQNTAAIQESPLLFILSNVAITQPVTVTTSAAIAQNLQLLQIKDVTAIIDAATTEVKLSNVSTKIIWNPPAFGSSLSELSATSKVINQITASSPVTLSSQTSFNVSQKFYITFSATEASFSTELSSMALSEKVAVEDLSVTTSFSDVALSLKTPAVEDGVLSSSDFSSMYAIRKAFSSPSSSTSIVATGDIRALSRAVINATSLAYLQPDQTEEVSYADSVVLASLLRSKVGTIVSAAQTTLSSGATKSPTTFIEFKSNNVLRAEDFNYNFSLIQNVLGIKSGNGDWYFSKNLLFGDVGEGSLSALTDTQINAGKFHIGFAAEETSLAGAISLNKKLNYPDSSSVFSFNGEGAKISVTPPKLSSNSLATSLDQAAILFSLNKFVYIPQEKRFVFKLQKQVSTNVPTSTNSLAEGTRAELRNSVIGVNLRVAPGTSSTIVVAIPDGTIVTIVGARRRVGSYDWVPVNVGVHKGLWMIVNYLVPINTTPQQSTETATQDAGLLGYSFSYSPMLASVAINIPSRNATDGSELNLTPIQYLLEDNIGLEIAISATGLTSASSAIKVYADGLPDDVGVALEIPAGTKKTARGRVALGTSKKLKYKLTAAVSELEIRIIGRWR